MRRARRALGGVLVAALAGTAPAVASRQAAGTADSAPPRAGRIALVPLDDRPRSLADVVRLAAIADVEAVTPPAGLLSRHLKTGDGDGLARWLDGLSLDSVDAVVVATDMLAYGGLLGSRTGRVHEPDARRRLEALGRLKSRRSQVPVLAFASLMRLAPTDDGGNPGWRQALATWAAHASAPGGTEASAIAAKAAAALPAGMLDAYKATRARNLATTLALVDLAARGAIDLLVLGDDEERAEGIHVEERAQIAAAVAKSAASERVVMRAGVEEAAPLLVGRAVLSRLKARPTVRVAYSSDEVRTRLAGAVAVDLNTLGVSAAGPSGTAGVVLEVFASGEAAPAEALARRITASRDLVAVADVGEAEGGSLALLEVLRSTRAYPRVAGYAAGPTPRAALVAALVHGVALSASADRLATSRQRAIADRVAAVHVRQLLGRAVEDVLYRDVAAPQAVDEVLAARGLDPNAVAEAQRPRLSSYLEKELTPLAQSLVADFGGRAWHLPSRRGTPLPAGILIKDVTKLVVAFPWGDMREPDITFDLIAEPAAAAPRPPAPRILR